jgi:hypothetical protein
MSHQAQWHVVNADPAKALEGLFKPAAESVRVWKANEFLRTHFQSIEASGQVLLQEMQELAQKYGAGLMSVNGHHEFYFENEDALPEGWFASPASNGVTYFRTHIHEDAKAKLRKLSDKFWDMCPKAALSSFIIQDIKNRDLPISEQIELFGKNGIDKAAETIEKIAHDYYITTAANLLKMPFCDEIKLSDYHKLKEEQAGLVAQADNAQLKFDHRQV